jgi:Tfp pilus assembly protein PilO
VTARDRIIIVVVLMAAALAGFWFVGLAPKRKDAADLKTQLDAAKAQLTQAQQSAATARQAKARYEQDYAELASLGKAVPKSDALPSLIYQMQSAAHDARIDFQSLKLTGGGGSAASAPTPSAAVAQASGSSSTGSSSTGSSSSSSSSSSTSTATAAPATQAATSTLPPGASVGAAGFPTMPFSFVFDGSYFDMESFLRDVQRFVQVNGDQVDVSGRLLSIDGFALTAGPKGLPDVTANISATAYLMSPSDTTTTPDTTTASPNTTASSGSSASTPTAAASGVLR